MYTEPLQRVTHTRAAGLHAPSGSVWQARAPVLLSVPSHNTARVMEVATRSSSRNGPSVSRAGQSRREPDSTAGHIELGRVDEQVLQDGEWQQQQQQCDGGGDDEEHEEQEQPSSGAEERGHAGDADAAAAARRSGMFQGGAL